MPHQAQWESGEHAVSDMAPNSVGVLSRATASVMWSTLSSSPGPIESAAGARVPGEGLRGLQRVEQRSGGAGAAKLSENIGEIRRALGGQ